MEFAQIQLNYFDWFFQDAKSKVELFKEYSIPIWVMEPLRGGELVSLSKDHTEKLKSCVLMSLSLPGHFVFFNQSQKLIWCFQECQTYNN